MKSEHCTSTPKEFIPLCEPYITGNEWSYVKDCLDTSWVSTSGSYIEQFLPKVLADRCTIMVVDKMGDTKGYITEKELAVSLSKDAHNIR